MVHERRHIVLARTARVKVGAFLIGVAGAGSAAAAEGPPSHVRVDLEAVDPSAAVEVVSINAWGLPAPIAPDRRRRMSRIADWLTDVDADVVAVQELWRGARPLFPLSVVSGDRVGDDGLALRAAAPFRQVDALAFGRARGFDAWKSKGALRGKVRLPSGIDVWVVVTHLQSGFGAANARVRAAQVDELLTWTADLDAPALFLGDFNMDARHPEDVPVLERLAAAGLVDLAETVGTLDPTYPDGRRYDRIYARSDATWTVVADAVVVVGYDDDPDTLAPTRLSDHRAMRARFHFVPTAAVAARP